MIWVSEVSKESHINIHMLRLLFFFNYLFIFFIIFYRGGGVKFEPPFTKSCIRPRKKYFSASVHFVVEYSSNEVFMVEDLI